MFSAELTKLIAAIAGEADLEPAILMAVIEVESSGRTFATVGGRREPLIRFEGHYFDRRLTREKREIARREGLAAPAAGEVKNPASQAARWDLLRRASKIDRRAAFESTSWGIGQVMGAHWAWLGYSSVDALVEEARSGPEGQIRIMLRYIRKAGLMEPLRRRDWSAFARGYNGSGFARHGYHVKLSLAYRRHARLSLEGTAQSPAAISILREGSRGEAVRHLQTLLVALGYPTAVDGIYGPRTRNAVLTFQRYARLQADGIAGPITIAAMEDALPLKPLGSGIWVRFVAILKAVKERWTNPWI